MIKRWLQEAVPRQRITELEAQVGHLNDFINDLKDEHDRALAQLTAERVAWEKRAHEVEDELRTQVEQYGKLEARYSELSARYVSVFTELNKVVVERDEALKKPVRPPRSNSRTKPPEKEG